VLCIAFLRIVYDFLKHERVFKLLKIWNFFEPLEKEIGAEAGNTVINIPVYSTQNGVVIVGKCEYRPALH
jgi:hypothetical protein